MSVLFWGTSAANGFDADGHYVRAEPLVGGCASYQKVLAANCSARFNSTAAADVASAAPSPTHTQVVRPARRDPPVDGLRERVVSLERDDAHLGPVACERLARLVGRAVVDDDRAMGSALERQVSEAAARQIPAVVRGNDHVDRAGHSAAW